MTTGRLYIDGDHAFEPIKVTILDGHRDDGQTELFVERNRVASIFTTADEFGKLADRVLVEMSHEEPSFAEVMEDLRDAAKERTGF